MFKNYLVYSTLLRFILNKPIFLYKNNWVVDYSSSLLRSLYSTLEYSCIYPLDIYTYGKSPYSGINYTLYSYNMGFLLKIRTCNTTSVRSSSSFWLVNSWYEREVREFYNIRFLNSSDSRCLLLPYSYINSKFICSSIGKHTYSLKYTLSGRCVKPVYRYSTVL